jgi:N12 class adenine-specific DNA methylase
MRPNKMKELGFTTFDQWATTFASPTNEVEYTMDNSNQKHVLESLSMYRNYHYYTTKLLMLETIAILY